MTPNDRSGTPPQEDTADRRVTRLLAWLGGLAALAVLIVLSAYFGKFGPQGLSGEQSVWGQFGDYVGGILNPLIALAAMIVLIYGVYLQRQELSATKAELARSNEIMKLQHEAMRVQAFDATFFQLMKWLSDQRTALDAMPLPRHLSDRVNIDGRSLEDWGPITLKCASEFRNCKSGPDDGFQAYCEHYKRTYDEGYRRAIGDYVQTLILILRQIMEFSQAGSSSDIHLALLRSTLTEKALIAIRGHLCFTAFSDIDSLRVAQNSGLFRDLDIQGATHYNLGTLLDHCMGMYTLGRP